MDQRNLSDTRDIGNVGLDSEGFPSDYDPKTVRGVPETSRSGDDYSGSGANSASSVNYEDQDDVREWQTQGEFSPDDEVFSVFSEVMDAPAVELEEDPEVVTDGGVPYDEEGYEETDTLKDVDHEGPYGGAPW